MNKEAEEHFIGPAQNPGPMQGQVLSKDGLMPPELDSLKNSWDEMLKSVVPQAGIV